MSFKKSIQNAFHSVVNFVSGSFLAPLAKSITESGGKILTEAALAAVKASESSGGSSETKFQNAFHAVVGVLASNGIKYTTVAVRGAIEAAVAQLNSK